MAVGADRSIKCGEYTPVGVLTTFGYLRDCAKQMSLNIPNGICLKCADFLDIYLSHLLPTVDKLIVSNHSLHSTQKVTLCNNRYQDLSKLERRVLRDIMILDSSQHITELECNPSFPSVYSRNPHIDVDEAMKLKAVQFGMNGCLWLKPFLLNCSDLNYLNLSHCHLNNECIQIVTDSLMKNKKNKALIWLDLSHNDIDDAAVKMLIPLIPKLSGLHLKNNKMISNDSLLLIRDYFQQSAQDSNCWFVDLQNTSIDGTKWKKRQIEDGMDLFVTKKCKEVNDWNGIRKSDYGPHGSEYQLVQTLLSKSGSAYLSARKITGDPNVPCGKVTWYVERIPKWIAKDTENYSRDVVPGKLQIRSDTTDVDGFSFEDMSIQTVSYDKLVRVWYNACVLHRVSI